MTDHAILPDDHVETAVLRNFAFDKACAVVGAYKGATMRYLFEHKARYVHGVEPQKWAYDLAVENLLAMGPHSWELDNLALVPWGTTPESKVILNDVGRDSASIVTKLSMSSFRDQAEVTAMNVCGWLEDHEYDFMVVNIEGGEYMILPWLMARATVTLVQYHGPPMPFNQLERVCDVNSALDVGKGWVLYT